MAKLSSDSFGLPFAVQVGGEVSMDDVLAAQMAARADDTGITVVAFTATPKTKTMELFGTRPDPSRSAAKDNLPTPFHVYSMRQAIEEKFILDVLQNDTTYKLAFKLANGGKELDDKEVERSAAMKGIMGWVRLHPYNIAQKVQIVVEHFRELVAPLLNGRGKAMVVVGSRKEAVRWQFAIDTYIKDRGYVNDVIKGKLLESQKLAVQATNNTKEQFANSPDLKTEITNAVMGALEAHTAMSTQALGSEVVREGLRDILLGPARLYETLREQAISKQAQSWSVPGICAGLGSKHGSISGSI
jgi:type I site-specific restriction-modification system R (restriction) subunit